MRQSWLFDAELQGGHVHLSIRCGAKDEARALAGQIVVREEEWPHLRDALTHGFAELGAELALPNYWQPASLGASPLRLEIIERGFDEVPT